MPQQESAWPEYSSEDRLTAMKLAMQEVSHGNITDRSVAHGEPQRLTPQVHQVNALQHRVSTAMLPSPAAPLPAGPVVMPAAPIQRGMSPVRRTISPVRESYGAHGVAEGTRRGTSPVRRMASCQKLERCVSPLRPRSPVRQAIPVPVVSIPPGSHDAQPVCQNKLITTAPVPQTSRTIAQNASSLQAPPGQAPCRVVDLLALPGPVSEVDSSSAQRFETPHFSSANTAVSASATPPRSDVTAVKQKVETIQLKMLGLLQGPEDLARCLGEAGMPEHEVERLLQSKEGIKEALRWISGIADAAGSSVQPQDLGVHESKSSEFGQHTVGNGSSRSTSSTGTGGDSYASSRSAGQSAVLFPNGRRVSAEDLARFLLEAGLNMNQVMSLMQTKEGIKESVRFIVAWVNSLKGGADASAVAPPSAAAEHIKQLLGSIAQVINSVAREHAGSGSPNRELMDVLNLVVRDLDVVMNNNPGGSSVPMSRLMGSLEGLMGELQAQWFAQSVAAAREQDGLPEDFCDYVRRVHQDLKAEMTRLEAWQSLEAVRLADTLHHGPSPASMETWSNIEDQLTCIEALYDEVLGVQRLIGDPEVAASSTRAPSIRGTPLSHTPIASAPTWEPLGVQRLVSDGTRTNGYTPNRTPASVTPTASAPSYYSSPALRGRG